MWAIVNHLASAIVVDIYTFPIAVFSEIIEPELQTVLIWMLIWLSWTKLILFSAIRNPLQKLVSLMCQKDACVCFCLWSVHFVNFDEFVFMFLIKFSLCNIQWNLSKPNFLGTQFCVRNGQVFSLYRLN